MLEYDSFFITEFYALSILKNLSSFVNSAFASEFIQA